MAGIKITDLPALASADAADYLCIVDVSDTSESAAGTTKKIEVGDFIENGSWTPTMTEGGAITATPTLTAAYYSRIGNIVTCAIQGLASFDFSSLDEAQITITMPTATTTFNSVGTCTVGSDKNINGIVGQNKIKFFCADTSAVDSYFFYAIFQYEIN
jgi:hypothetical protein